MTDVTSRVSLPYILPGQAQKEMFHNEALLRLDIIVAALVEEEPGNTPPAIPTPGFAYLVGTSPTGAWVGQAANIAAYDTTGWRFVAPLEGWSVWVRSLDLTATFVDGAWETGLLKASRLVIGNNQVVGSRAAAIANPVGGSVIDSEARSAIGSILTMLRGHGLIAS